MKTQQPRSNGSSTRNLLLLPIPEAVGIKWTEGRQKYGEDWHGEHPALELHSEGLDALNYIWKLEQHGADSKVCHELRMHALNLVQGARLLAESLGVDRPPTEDIPLSETLPPACPRNGCGD